MTADEYTSLGQSTEEWYCDHCKSVMANRLKWGTLEGEDAISKEIDAAYKIICTWKKNFFLLPFGKAGTDFIRELTRLMNLFVNRRGID